MSDSNLTTTTFHYDKNKYWTFKHIVALQHKTVKEISSQLLDRVIEDYQDQKIRVEIENGFNEPTQLWITMKRRMGLDGASSHSKQ